MTRYVLVFAIVMLCLCMACGKTGSSSENSSETTADTSGNPAEQNTLQVSNDDPMHATITVEDGLPIVIDFSATWCPPCQKLKPIFATLTKEYAGKVTMVTVDVDENTEMAQRFGVQSIPTLIFFNSKGEQIDRTMGLISEGELRSRLDALSSEK